MTVGKNNGFLESIRTNWIIITTIVSAIICVAVWYNVLAYRVGRAEDGICDVRDQYKRVEFDIVDIKISMMEIKTILNERLPEQRKAGTHPEPSKSE